MGRKISLRDMGRDLHTQQLWDEYQTLRKELAEASLTRELDLYAAREWYRKHGFKEDVGFRKRTDRSRYVECVICQHSGAGIMGTYWEAIQNGLSRQWQYDHLTPHLFECACGLWFHKSQSLGTHVSANRRHRNPGHGRMDRVG